MRIRIVTVGRERRDTMGDLATDYARMIRWPLEHIEIDSRKADMPQQQADLILAALPDNTRLIALDERGKDMSSTALAQAIEGWDVDGENTLYFVIGGADGLDKKIREKADIILSFGKQTWPHRLVRVMLLEQLYRAQQIIAGHPYHRA